MTRSNKVNFYLAPMAVPTGGLQPCSGPMNMPGVGDVVNYNLKVVDVFYATSLLNVIVVA